MIRKVAVVGSARRWPCPPSPRTPRRASRSTTAATPKCKVCHSVAGEGNAKGSLDGVGGKLKADEIKAWMRTPKEMAEKAKAERKPPMPAYSEGEAVRRRPGRPHRLSAEPQEVAGRGFGSGATGMGRVARTLLGLTALALPPGARGRGQDACLECHGLPGQEMAFRRGRDQGREPRPRGLAEVGPRAGRARVPVVPHRARRVPAPRRRRGHRPPLHAGPQRGLRGLPRGAGPEVRRRRAQPAPAGGQREGRGVHRLPRPPRLGAPDRSRTRAPCGPPPGWRCPRPAPAAMPKSTPSTGKARTGPPCATATRTCPPASTATPCTAPPTRAPPGSGRTRRRSALPATPTRRRWPATGSAPPCSRPTWPTSTGPPSPSSRRPTPTRRRTSPSATTATACTTSPTRTTRRRACG